MYRNSWRSTDDPEKRNLLFRGRITFEEAYPQIESIIIEYTEYGMNAYNSINERSNNKGYRRCIDDKNRVPEKIICSNSCNEGGFNILSEISDMVIHGETEREFCKSCHGSIGSTKRNKSYKPCGNYIEGKISIVYKV